MIIYENHYSGFNTIIIVTIPRKLTLLRNQSDFPQDYKFLLRDFRG